MSVRLACALLALALPLVVCTGAPKLAVDRLAREHSRSIARERSNVKIGIRRELSTVDLKKDLATPELPRPTEESTGAKGPPAAQTGRAPAVIRANSFTGPTPHIDPAELEPYQSRPKRGKSFCPPRRETSQADLADLSAPPRSPSRQAILRDPETAAAEQELKAEVLRTHGIVVGEVSREEEESWLSRIEYTGEVLGVGGFSVVHAAQDTKDQTIKYAVKVVKIPADNACFVRRLVREVRLLQELDHPNIVKLHKVLESPDTCHLFMEHCTGGELLGLMDHMEFDDDGVRSLQFDDLHSGEAVEFSEQQIVYILHQVLEAVKHCHDRCIVHRDLKMENVLLSEPWQQGNRQVKLADFGFATVLKENERLTSACGSPHYCSPEILDGNSEGSVGYRLECDVWAVGVIAYSLLCCQYPFDGETDADVVKAVSKGEFEFGDHVKVSDDAQDFVRSLIVKDPKKRFTIEMALQHPWISNNVAAGKAHATGLVKEQKRREAIQAELAI